MKINFTLKRTKNFNNICVAALNRQPDSRRTAVEGVWSVLARGESYPLEEWRAATTTLN